MKQPACHFAMNGSSLFQDLREPVAAVMKSWINDRIKYTFTAIFAMLFPTGSRLIFLLLIFQLCSLLLRLSRVFVWLWIRKHITMKVSLRDMYFTISSENYRFFFCLFVFFTVSHSRFHFFLSRWRNSGKTHFTPHVKEFQVYPNCTRAYDWLHSFLLFLTFFF